MQPTPSLRQSPLVLILGMVAFIVLLVLWGGWALPVIIFSILAMIMIHEFGHFITAKRAGLLVTDFFVGFGPVLWSRQIGETRYGIRVLPFGGYVKVPGMTWQDDSVDPKNEKRTYRSASYPKKVLFASAGSLTHVIIAILLAWASLAIIGLPSSKHVTVAEFTKWDGHKETVAQRAGMKVGDQLVAVNGVKVTGPDQLTHLLHGYIAKSIAIVVDRSGRDLTLHMKPVNGQHITVDGKKLSHVPKGYIGIDVGEASIRTSPLAAIPKSFTLIGSVISGTFASIGHVFSPHELSSLAHQVVNARAANKPVNQDARPVSIVGVVRYAVQTTQSSWLPTFEIFIDLNIFIAILNMFPILPVDGGYVAIATYERLRSRRRKKYQADINKLAPLIYAFVGVLLILSTVVLYLDIAHPITGN